MKNYTIDSREGILEWSLREYRRKPGNVQAVKINEPFTVDTLEGRVTAKAGDYLVFGDQNDVWPVDQTIFESRYELDE